MKYTADERARMKRCSLCSLPPAVMLYSEAVLENGETQLFGNYYCTTHARQVKARFDEMETAYSERPLIERG